MSNEIFFFFFSEYHHGLVDVFKSNILLYYSDYSFFGGIIHIP